MGNLFGELMAVRDRRVALAQQVQDDLKRQGLDPVLLTEPLLDETSAELTRMVQKYKERGYELAWSARAVVEDGKLRVQLSAETSKGT